MNQKSAIPESILCVCLGNICRSPTADAIFTSKLANTSLNIRIDSAGTSASHVNEPPDKRSQEHAKKRGYDLSYVRSRQVSSQDFYDFDLILAMDIANLNQLNTLKARLQENACSSKQASTNTAALAKVQLFSAASTTHKNQPVPDPYYGGTAGFEAVLDMCEACVDAWIKTWTQPLPAT